MTHSQSLKSVGSLKSEASEIMFQTSETILSVLSFLSTRPTDKWLMNFTRPNGRFTRPKFQ